MQKVEGDPVPTPIWGEFQKIIEKHDRRGADCIDIIDKWDFYKRTQEMSMAVVMTSETAQYANIILKKGVVKP